MKSQRGERVAASGFRRPTRRADVAAASMEANGEQIRALFHRFSQVINRKVSDVAAKLT